MCVFYFWTILLYNQMSGLEFSLGLEFTEFCLPLPQSCGIKDMDHTAKWIVFHYCIWTHKLHSEGTLAIHIPIVGERESVQYSALIGDVSFLGFSYFKCAIISLKFYMSLKANSGGFSHVCFPSSVFFINGSLRSSDLVKSLNSRKGV